MAEQWAEDVFDCFWVFVGTFALGKIWLYFFSKKLGFVDFLIVVCLAGVFIVEVTEAKKSAVSRKIYSLGLIIEGSIVDIFSTVFRSTYCKFKQFMCGFRMF